MNLVSKRHSYVSLKFDYAFRELFSNENVRKQFLGDVLGIPLKEIRSVRVVNLYLWKRLRRQKQGILDMAMEMWNGTKVNIEMQVRRQNYWVKRQLFYLAKMYIEDLREGQDYSKLRKCISIGILDFNLTEDEEYHSTYWLQDKRGRKLTDLLELHIIELKKTIQDTEAVDDWIRLFHAESEEDLKMIKAKNQGIAEAMELVRTMSLRKTLRYLHEERLKAIRDRKAEDEYVWDQGKAEGKAEDILQLLSDRGDIPSDLRTKIMSENNLDILGTWLKSAARSESIEEFREQNKI